MFIRELFRRLVPYPIRQALGARSEFCHSSYAQEGEDRVLLSLLGFPERLEVGFYIDVGAHHPLKYSNTYLFYELGWRGLNIDARPGSMEAFQRIRPRDINLEAAVAAKEGSLTFYEFNEPALNGFCPEVASARNGLRTWKIVRESQIETVPLAKILERHLPPGQVIDFMSVDVEGLDLEVLRSNEWQKFRPAILLVEDSGEVTGADRTGSEISSFLEAHAYQFCCKTPLTSFFVAREAVIQTAVGLRVKGSRAESPLGESPAS